MRAEGEGDPLLSDSGGGSSDSDSDSGRGHLLCIDVEGYDFDVMLGANNTLAKTEYLEFEYSTKLWNR